MEDQDVIKQHVNVKENLVTFLSIQFNLFVLDVEMVCFLFIVAFHFIFHLNVKLFDCLKFHILYLFCFV
jgi:hypothetical protein